MKTVFEWRIEDWHSTVLLQVNYQYDPIRAAPDTFYQGMDIVTRDNVNLMGTTLVLSHCQSDDVSPLAMRDFGEPDKAQAYVAKAKAAIRNHIKNVYPADRVFVESDGRTETFMVLGAFEEPDSTLEEL